MFRVEIKWTTSCSYHTFCYVFSKQSNVLRITFTGRNNTHTAFQNRILCLMTHGWWERHMIMGEKQNQATRHADVINISRSKVFSSFRKESFAPPRDILLIIGNVHPLTAAIHLLCRHCCNATVVDRPSILIFSATIHQLLKHSAHCRPVFSHLLLKRLDYASRSSFAA